MLSVLHNMSMASLDKLTSHLLSGWATNVRKPTALSKSCAS